MSLELRLLCPLSVFVDGEDATPTPPKQRALLALLALRAGHAPCRSQGRRPARRPAPARAQRARARYQARIGHLRSQRLRLVRRMVATSLRRQGATFVLRGRVRGPRAGRPAPISVDRFRTCGHAERVKAGRAVPDRRGRFAVRFPVSPEGGPALYRARTRVAVRPGGRASAPTFTLPQPAG